ncbi:MAG TPA: hypothetical protein VKS22_07180 [Candidatus Binataceae bacterium]|nr:hypothetical protein [Candidatus Binataceae bacterium]
MSTAPIAAYGLSQCADGDNDNFIPLDVGDGSNYNGTGFINNYYGPDQATGSNRLTGLTGGSSYLADLKNIANGAGVSGGPSGVKPRCSNGALPAASVCGDGSTPTIGVVFIGQSLLDRIVSDPAAKTSAAALGTFQAAGLKGSMLYSWANPSSRTDQNGDAVYTNLTVNPAVTLANCAIENHNLDLWASESASQGGGSWGSPTTSWGICKNVRVPNFVVAGTAAQALTMAQVQVVILSMTIAYQQNTMHPMSDLGGADCRASNLTGGGGTDVLMCDIAHDTGIVIRNLMASGGFTNLQEVIVSNVKYEGYTAYTTQPPPCDHEEGFGVKKVMWAQLNQVYNNSGTVQDTIVGDLCHKSPCPGNETPITGIVLEGPPLWTNGSTTVNSENVKWTLGAGSGGCMAQGTGDDFNTSSDRCVHPSLFGNGTGGTKTSLPNGASKQAWSMFDWLVNNANPSGSGLAPGGSYWWTNGAAPTPTATPTPKASAFSVGP